MVTKETHELAHEAAMKAAMKIVYGDLFPKDIKLPTAEQVAKAQCE